MDDIFKENVDSLAEEIRSQARELRVDTLLSFLYTSEIIDKYLDLEIGDQPITRAGFIVLHHLILNNATMIPTDISTKTFRSKHAVTKVIDTLEKQGFVKRTASESGADRRIRRVAITRKGLNLVKKATTGSRERMSQVIFRSLDKTQVEEFNRVLKQLRKDTLDLIDKSTQSK
jgi:DNA-binding MarR family transcriptional regulator